MKRLRLVAAKTVLTHFNHSSCVNVTSRAAFSGSRGAKNSLYRQYKALQLSSLPNREPKGRDAASISTQLSNVYVPAPPTTSSYAAVAQSTTVGTLSPVTILTI